ncbi:hypothetical protein PAXRUDRAFT_172944, partial [Paxillus rubicundulus Ve08.2h10]
LKTLYYTVVDLKNAFGLTYTDWEGARVTPQDKDIWDSYVKVNSLIYHICFMYNNNI